MGQQYIHPAGCPNQFCRQIRFEEGSSIRKDFGPEFGEYLAQGRPHEDICLRDQNTLASQIGNVHPIPPDFVMAAATPCDIYFR
jgi:hypothetical protein